MVARTPARLAPERLAVWRRFLEAHAHVVAALEAELLDERGLPLAWYDVLAALHEAPRRRLRMQDLADRVLFSRSGITRLVDRMAAADYVTRERCADDGRGTYAVLTAAGARCLRTATGAHLRGVREHFDRHLNECDITALDRALRALLVGERDAPGRPASGGDDREVDEERFSPRVGSRASGPPGSGPPRRP